MMVTIGADVIGRSFDTIYIGVINCSISSNFNRNLYADILRNSKRALSVFCAGTRFFILLFYLKHPLIGKSTSDIGKGDGNGLILDDKDLRYIVWMHRLINLQKTL